MTESAKPAIRLYSDGDREGLLSFLGRTISEMGYEFDIKGHSDLGDVAGHYLGRRGSFYVLEMDDEIVGTAAVRPLSREIGFLFLNPES